MAHYAARGCDSLPLKTLTSLFAFACAALALGSPATAQPRFGVAEDAGKYADDGGAAFFATLSDLGMTENRMWVWWDPARPDRIVEKPFLDRVIPVAQARGIKVKFSVSPLRPRGITASPLGETQFVEFLQELARTYPYVKDIIVGNEPNQPRFWQPQFVRGRGVSAAAYTRLLARSYDALKAVDPEIQVIGVGLSPRGNDRPNAKSNVSTSPVRFIRGMGIAYRRSGRTKPLMDQFGFHSYPRFDRDPLARGYQWPNAGITNLARIKQAVWDAFHGTAQPTFPEDGAEHDKSRTLSFVLDEVGWQATIPRAFRRAYHGRESVRPTTEAAHARIYAQIVDLVACDATVDSLLFFHLIDDRDLDRFQSGLLRADGSRRPAYNAVKGRIRALTSEDGTVRCPAQPARWRHTTKVVGATARFTQLPRRSEVAEVEWTVTARATEEATLEVGVLPLADWTVSARERAALEYWSPRTGSPLALAQRQLARAYVPTKLSLSTSTLQRGDYVHVVRLVSTMNPRRSSVFLSHPFRVG